MTDVRKIVESQPKPSDPNPNHPVDDGFRDIPTDRCMYKPSAAGGKPLVGYLMNVLDMPPVNNRAWQAFLFRTTQPTVAVDRDNNPITIQPGQEVLIPVTAQLRQIMSGVAVHPTTVYEWKITPDKKADIGGGQSMWTYKLSAKPGGVNRDNFGPSAQIGTSPTPKQLTAGPGDASADGIPF